MAAASARQDQLDSIADNLANAQTPGYKAQRPAFQSFLPAKGAAVGVTDKVFTAAVATGTDLSPGPVTPTDNPMDVIPDGQSFLAVSSLSGQPAYTRNGKLTLNTEGMLVVDGHAVLGMTGKPIMIPTGADVTVSQEGVVSADGEAVDRLAMFNLQGNVVRVGPQLYAPGPGGSVVQTDTRLTTGELEMGNATPLESMVSMINAQRQFEMATQAIQTYRRLDDRAIEVGKMR